MTKVHSQDRTSSEAISKSWNKVYSCCRKSDVPEYQRRWYVIRDRGYVKTNRDTPLRDQNPRSLRFSLQPKRILLRSIRKN